MKKKVLLGFGFALLSIASLMFLAGVVFGIGCIFYNPFLAPQMTKYYSNDSNYTWYEATISECDKNDHGYITIKEITRVDNNEPLKNINSMRARIFSPDIEKTWDAFNPYEGLKFEFKGTMAVFFDGCPAAIVEITSNGETILSYQDGKSALLEWAKGVH